MLKHDSRRQTEDEEGYEASMRYVRSLDQASQIMFSRLNTKVVDAYSDVDRDSRMEGVHIWIVSFVNLYKRAEGLVERHPGACLKELIGERIFGELLKKDDVTFDDIMQLDVNTQRNADLLAAIMRPRKQLQVVKASSDAALV